MPTASDEKVTVSWGKNDRDYDFTIMKVDDHNDKRWKQ